MTTRLVRRQALCGSKPSRGGDSYTISCAIHTNVTVGQTGFAPVAVLQTQYTYRDVYVLMQNGIHKYVRTHRGPRLPRQLTHPYVTAWYVMAHKTPKMPIVINPDAQSGESERVSPNQKVHQGLIFFIKLIIPNYPNNVLTTMTILDSDGDEIYNITDLTRGKKHIISEVQVPLVESERVQLTLSGVPGGTQPWINYVTLYYLSDYT